MELNGKTVVLTGASGGIGSALALELCAEGAQVIAVGRRSAALEARWSPTSTAPATVGASPRSPLHPMR